MRKLFSLSLLLTAIIVLNAPLPFAWAAEESSPPAKADDKKDEKKEAPKKGEGGEGEGGKKAGNDVSGGRFAGDPVYVHLAPMVLPVISSAGVEQIVTIQIDVEVDDFDVADQMHSNMPKVMDALMTSLYGGLGQGSLRNGKLVDVNKVKIKAVAALENILGQGKIKNVLIQGVAQRML